MILQHESALYCAGCKEKININTPAPDVVVLTPFRFKPGRVHGQPVLTLHRDEACARRLNLNWPTACPEWRGLTDAEPTAEEWQASGFYIEGVGDDRGYARLHYVGSPVGVAV